MKTELQELIRQLEEATGYKAVVSSVSDIETYSQIISAGPNNPVHLIRINSKYSQFGDYTAAIQIIMTIFKWKDPENIPDFGVLNEKVKYLSSKLANRNRPQKFPLGAWEGFVSSLITSLLQQLHSTPFELMAISYCREQFPGFNSLQEQCVENQLRENIKALSPQIQEFAPKDIFDKNASMNAAFALHWSRITEDNSFLLPYKAMGFFDMGSDLYKIYNKLVDFSQPQVAIVAIVNAWAEFLSLKTMYTWSYRKG